MVEYREKDGSHFTVDLGSVKLAAITEKQVETDIRAVVLNALAESGVDRAGRFDSSIFDRFPGRTLGLWLDPELPFPTPSGPLTPKDHTLIVREVMKYPFHVVRYLDVERDGSRPSDMAVLEAALQVEQIDEFVKELIRKVLDVLQQLDEARSQAPKAMQRAVDSLERQLAGQPIDAQVRMLRDTQLRNKQTQEGIREGMETAAQILEDGASTIYSPDFGFNRTLREGQPSAARKDVVDGVKDADTLGGVAGGGVGIFVGGVGAGPGAAAGAAGASAGYAIAAVIDWLF